MTLSELGNLGEAIGGIAVLVSLVYLAIQIRQNTKATRASTLLGLTNAWQDYLLQAIQPSMVDLLQNSARDPEGMSRSDLLRFFLLTRIIFRRFENDFLQFESGTFDTGSWEGYRNAFVQDVLALPAFRAMWKQQRDSYAPGFVRFVDEQAELISNLPNITLEDFENLWKARLKEERVA